MAGRKHHFIQRLYYFEDFLTIIPAIHVTYGSIVSMVKFSLRLLKDTELRKIFTATQRQLTSTTG